MGFNSFVKGAWYDPLYFGFSMWVEQNYEIDVTDLLQIFLLVYGQNTSSKD